jgi:TonB family protein
VRRLDATCGKAFAMLGSAAMPDTAESDLYSLAEIAAAADVADAVVLDLAARGHLLTLGPIPDATPMHALVAGPAAIAAVRALASGATPGAGVRSVIAVVPVTALPAGLPVVVSTGLHAVVALALVGIASLGLSLGAAPPVDEIVAHEPVRLVYLSLPGPGGGGGGGGLKQPLPAPKAQREGSHSLTSPLPAPAPPPPAEPPPVEPLDAKPLPPVMAPVASAPSDAATVDGVMKEAPATDSRGTGTEGGTGTGRGKGMGEGDGAGIGDGTGGGTGGGPYRPGSGVEPPRLLREVKASYTDEARRAGITGNVEMEITIRRDGSVSDIRILRGLGGGLNDRAAAAVRQWRFAPARLKGTPVDVIVEVAVEFTLR